MGGGLLDKGFTKGRPPITPRGAAHRPIPNPALSNTARASMPLMPLMPRSSNAPPIGLLQHPQPEAAAEAAAFGCA